MEFLDTKTIWTIVHLIGVAAGAGGAYISDVMFFSAVKDEKIDKTEMRFLKIASSFVWVGLAILIISGLGLFLTDPAYYMESSKFLAKMSVVAILTINGLVFHFSHLPILGRHVDCHFPSSKEFMSCQPFLLTSGAISIVSWTFALIFGALRSVPYTYWQIMIFYGIILLIAEIVALKFFRHKPLHK